MLHNFIQYECYTMQHARCPQERSRQEVNVVRAMWARTCSNPAYYTVDPVVAGSSPVALADVRAVIQKGYGSLHFQPLLVSEEFEGNLGAISGSCCVHISLPC